MLQRAKLGMAMFLLSEAVFFVMLIVAFVYLHGSSAPAARSLRVQTTSLFTALLLASSFTMWRAASNSAKDRSTGRRVWLAATMALGTAFLIGQASEYARLFHEKITISQSIFGTTFFTLTAFHGLHVLVGIVLLGVMLAMVSMDGSGEFPSIAVEVTAMFWYFVDAVWIAIFAVVYLGRFA